jgi:dihydrofolate reductase
MISAIVAYDNGGMMGRNGGLPWHLPDDLRHFKAATMGRPVVMGHTTWKSLGRPLPGRRNIVLSRTATALSGAEVAPNLGAGLGLCEAEDPFIIGGRQVYSQALTERRIDRLIVSLVRGVFDGDLA